MVARSDHHFQFHGTQGWCADGTAGKMADGTRVRREANCSRGRWVAATKQDRPQRIDHRIAGLAYGAAYRTQRRPSRYKTDLRPA